MENLISNQKKKGEEDGEEKKKRPVIKSATDLQRLKLEKLMKNPEKPIIIPEPPKEKDYMQTVPSFVRNVMGSSAGAGSGEFHVYRHLRRKEYARQKCIQAKSMREQLDDEYQSKLEKNRLAAEAKTAKKRAKRLKKKQRAKRPKTKQNDEKDEEKQETTEDDDDEEEDGDDENTVVEVAAKDSVTDEADDISATETEVKVENLQPEDTTEAQTDNQEVVVDEYKKKVGTECSESEANAVDDKEVVDNSQTEEENKSDAKESTCEHVERPKLEELPI